MVSFNRLAFLSFQSTITKRSFTSVSNTFHFSRCGGNKIHVGLPIAFLSSLGLAVGTTGGGAAAGCSHADHTTTSTFVPSRSNTNKRSTCTQLMASSSSSSTNTRTRTCTSNNMTIETGYLDAKDAYDLDQHLFANGYTLEQLMELAGLAVAEAVYQSVPPSDLDSDSDPVRLLIVCGPGNNGGDGLVAARHLSLFGYHVSVLYPKHSKREEQKHYNKLVTQCLDVGVQFIDSMPSPDSNDPKDKTYDAVVDAIFGFSFRGEPREPFASILQTMIEMQNHPQSNTRTCTQIISVDVPSGWNVDDGPTRRSTSEDGSSDADSGQLKLVPDVLVSLTAPKLCAKGFHGRHFVGGRFLPPRLGEKYGIRMPPYPGVAQVMEVGGGSSTKDATPREEDARVESSSTEGWEAAYAGYCAEKEKELDEKDAADLKKQTDKENKGTSTDEDADVQDWALQYHNYCIEKEARLAEEDKAKETTKKAGNHAHEQDGWESQYAAYLLEKATWEEEKDTEK